MHNSRRNNRMTRSYAYWDTEVLQERIVMITTRLFRMLFPLRYGSAKECSCRVRIQPNHPCRSRRATSVRRWNIWVTILAMCYFLSSATPARAQLWEVPPLPPGGYGAGLAAVA